MKLAKVRHAEGWETVGLVEDESVTLFEPGTSLQQLLEASDPPAQVRELETRARTRVALDSLRLLAPIDRQEVWAAGVTYRRSQVARMEESEGGASFYDKVYGAARPELFYKATPHRVSGPGQAVRIRQDATWSVPEPELALVLNSRLELVGFTIGNDMSSRDIEGENPLYLPQAKLYLGSCALGPWITLAAAMPRPEEIEIEMVIERAERQAFAGKVSVDQMARSFADLIGWLARDNSFPDGAILLTGTGIVPPNDFTLEAGDVIAIAISGIGRLRNTVVQGPAS
ncbi:MAG TPA: fumarylacetoacetate hydrolase family protein [Pirellulales bacterium]|jgi:2-dehydro-3-deoxy-D-arabinonate dehydratase|nr:fumarylacetoacetate hydrolase family protein [Pirellulales bacterium]